MKKDLTRKKKKRVEEEEVMKVKGGKSMTGNARK